MRRIFIVLQIGLVALSLGCSATSVDAVGDSAPGSVQKPKAPVGVTDCADRVEGDWDYGTAPSACNVTATATPEQVRFEYSPVIISEGQAASGGRFKYMSLMYTVVRDMAVYYIHRRNPQVGMAEEQGFLAAILALVTQESKWTHYRDGTDGILRFMRGDKLHGYGLMQVDDRSFLTDIKQGRGADLVANMLFGLDIFYAHWLQAASAKCVKAGDWKSRARSAWAAYNGGDSAICRWTKKKNHYVSHDNSYLKNYTGRPWSTYVADLDAPSPLNVRCLAEGVRPCPADRNPASGSATNDVRPPTAPSMPPVLLGESKTLKTDVSYRLLRQCADVTCDFNRSALHKGEGVEVLTDDGKGWVQVLNPANGQHGWLKKEDLAEN